MSTINYLGKPCLYGHDGTRYISNKCCVECSRGWSKKNKERAKHNNKFWFVRKKYQIEESEYLELLQKQDSKCAICKSILSLDSSFNIHVDHCHKTGKVRGLLCNSCNVGLGRFKDSINTLSNAIVYLKENT